MKVSAMTVDGKRVIGDFIRHIDQFTSVVYAGGYESVIVERKTMVRL